MSLLSWWNSIIANSNPTSQPTVTPRATRMITLAKTHASEAVPVVEPNLTHLLLAFSALNDGCAHAVFKRLGFDMRDLIAAARSDVDPPSLPALLVLAEQERKKIYHDFLGTEHLLLALISHGNNGAAKYLAHEGLTLESAREEVLKELDPNFAPTE